MPATNASNQARSLDRLHAVSQNVQSKRAGNQALSANPQPGTSANLAPGTGTAENLGTLEPWNLRTLEPWNLGT